MAFRSSFPNGFLLFPGVLVDVTIIPSFSDAVNKEK
jgi:hypothetical protein